MMPFSGFCFHANITNLAAELTEVVDCHLIGKLRADEAVEFVVEWDDTIITCSLYVGVFAEVTCMVFITAP
jgi:hypothetical protein